MRERRIDIYKSKQIFRYGMVSVAIVMLLFVSDLNRFLVKAVSLTPSIVVAVSTIFHLFVCF